MGEKDRIAYLGPAGSYSELAVKTFLPAAKALSCNSIAEVFSHVANNAADAGLVPIENVIQGPVTETLDCLFEHRSKICIEESFTLNIEHCLGGAPGSSLESIKDVYSHQQALSQCSGFLSSSLGNAAQHAVSSTGMAAKSVAEKGDSGSAVIASKQTIEENGLAVLAREIADSTQNKTRFVLIRAGEVSADKIKVNSNASHFVTSIAVDPGRDRQGLLFDLMRVISEQHGVNLLSIHSRPDPRGVFIFHIDLGGSLVEERIASCLDALNKFCKESTGDTAEIIVCGSYRQEPFHEVLFSSVGIIGGHGQMGQWFESFFKGVGLEVFVSDPVSPKSKDNLSLKELAERSDVLLFSVPMSAATDVVQEVAPYLTNKHLVVENCSIKGVLLPMLVEVAPEGAEILGIHTMFGSSVSEMRSQNVIVVRTESSREKADALEALFYKIGARITPSTIEEHDKASALLQALVQLAVLAVGETISEEFSNPDQASPFSTPNSRALVSILERIVNQRDDLLVDLQLLNTQYPAVRKQFEDRLKVLGDAIATGDRSALSASIEACRKFLQ